MSGGIAVEGAFFAVKARYGRAIERTQDITLVYGVIGIVVFLNGIAFSFGALARPERQVHEEKGGDDAQDPVG